MQATNRQKQTDRQTKGHTDLCVNECGFLATEQPWTNLFVLCTKYDHAYVHWHLGAL